MSAKPMTLDEAKARARSMSKSAKNRLWLVIRDGESYRVEKAELDAHGNRVGGRRRASPGERRPSGPLPWP